jgi:heme exporter protein CcmD
MNHWAFIWTAYGLTLAATLGLLVQSMRALRAAEKDVLKMGERN